MTQKDKPAAWPESITAAFPPFPSADTGNASPAAGSDTNPFMQPFAQSIAGGVDFVKKLWGGVPGGGAVPGFMVPTMDLEELDKRIKDLRTVESWLAMNTNILRATIQGLEVQKMALNAMKVNAGAASDAANAFANMTRSAPSPAPAQPEPAAPDMNPLTNPMLWPWAMMQGAITEQPPAESKPKQGKDRKEGK